jgi:hypothetical protein
MDLSTRRIKAELTCWRRAATPQETSATVTKGSQLQRGDLPTLEENI